jgi:hypothetical protein
VKTCTEDILSEGPEKRSWMGNLRMVSREAWRKAQSETEMGKGPTKSVVNMEKKTCRMAVACLNNRLTVNHPFP